MNERDFGRMSSLLELVVDRSTALRDSWQGIIVGLLDVDLAWAAVLDMERNLDTVKGLLKRERLKKP